MRIAVMQPTYLPWIGYFDMIDQVDHFVFLDDAQVVKQSWGVRNRIKTAQGELMLSVPFSRDQSIKERLYCNTLVHDQVPWVKKHLRSVQLTYSKAPFFQEIIEDYEELLNGPDRRLGMINSRIIQFFSKKIGIETPFTYSSELQGLTGRKDVRLVSICRALGANTYLSAQGSAEYIESERPGGAFTPNGIALYYHHFEHPEYPQLHGEFLPYLCILDLLFNCGYDQALAVIRSGRKEPYTRDEFVKLLRE